MFITYELYRSKNDELCDRETIEWILEKDVDIIEFKERLNILLAQHISNIDIVKKYGTGYIGRMVIKGVEITDKDYTCELDKDHFIEYIHNEDVIPNLKVIWNKTTNNITSNKKSVKTKRRKNTEEGNE